MSNVLECSTKGDKRFSAWYATVKMFGITTAIEWHYQGCKRFAACDSAYYSNPKGKKPSHIEINDIKLTVKYLTPYYKLLWVRYLDSHPELVEYASQFDEFNDSFRGKSINCQADVIKQYVKEGRKSILKEPMVQKLIKKLKNNAKSSVQ